VAKQLHGDRMLATIKLLANQNSREAVSSSKKIETLSTSSVAPATQDRRSSNLKPVDKLEVTVQTHPARKEAAKIDLLLKAKGHDCRECTHVKYPEVIAPSCTKYTEMPHSKRIRVAHEVELPRFCHDVRKDEYACSWDGKGWERPKVKETVFMGERE